MNESAMTAYVLPLLIGVVAGLRAMTAPAAVSIGAYLGQLSLANTTLAFLSSVWAAGILGLLAVVEFVTDQLPSTPSRKVPQQFGARLLTGGFSGAAIGASGGSLATGLIAGAIGAVIGTYGGARIPIAVGRDVPERSAGRLHRGCRRRRAGRLRGGRGVMKTFDAIIIGAGQAGPPLAGRLTGAGLSVAIVERKLFGGTCVNTGCMPTKTLVASAYAAHLARRGADYGVVLGGPVGIDMAKVSARAKAVSTNSRTGIESWLRGMKNCTVLEGQATFEGADTVRVGDEQLTAPRIFINVGGRALVPDLPGVHDVPFLTNTTMVALDRAAEAPDRRGRQLRRSRVRADVPSLRQRGDHRRAIAATHFS